MYKIIPWNQLLDLSYFYSEAEKRGFHNNSSQKVMIDCFKNERLFKAWILFKDNIPVGSVCCHSLDELGPNSYRICARTCNLTETRPINGLLTLNRMMKEHQHVTPQFYIPANIEFCGEDSNMYISSNNSDIASQKIVHNLYCPTMEKLGILSKECELEYRGHFQTFWKLNVKNFKESLNRYPRWV
jgi:hypothetical protein